MATIGVARVSTPGLQAHNAGSGKQEGHCHYRNKQRLDLESNCFPVRIASHTLYKIGNICINLTHQCQHRGKTGNSLALTFIPALIPD
jgi:hypothetical protein